jgi:hypothetical protein
MLKISGQGLDRDVRFDADSISMQPRLHFSFKKPEED